MGLVWGLGQLTRPQPTHIARDLVHTPVPPPARVMSAWPLPRGLVAEQVKVPQWWERPGEAREMEDTSPPWRAGL